VRVHIDCRPGDRPINCCVTDSIITEMDSRQRAGLFMEHIMLMYSRKLPILQIYDRISGHEPQRLDKTTTIVVKEGGQGCGGAMRANLSTSG